MHRERAEEDGIEQADDGGVRADAERHRDDGERSEAGFAEELAKAEADVLDKSFHAYCRARGLSGGLDHAPAPLRACRDVMRGRGGSDSGNFAPGSRLQ